MNKAAPLILASASLRRKEILEAHGFTPIVIPSDAYETLPTGMSFTPEQTTVYLAELKAKTVLDTLDPDDWPDGCRILGVDTIVFKDRIIGKPVDEADALDILRSLRNASHEVISGVCLIHAQRENPSWLCGEKLSEDLIHPQRENPLAVQVALTAVEKLLFHDTTTVTFDDYSDEEILAYIRANPPYDKSGSYAIQSDWGKHALEIDGDIENVIGLPYKKLSGYL